MNIVSQVESRIEKLQLNILSTVNNPKLMRLAGIFILAFGAVVIGADAVFAFTAPTAGTFAYTVYDVAVTKMLNGPIGFVGGVGAMVFGAVLAIQQKVMTAVSCILGGAILMNAESLVTTLGLTF